MANVNDFFIQQIGINDVSPEEYNRIEEPLKSSFDALSRITYKSFYVVDYYRQNFLYVSANPFFLCGHKPEEVKEMGYAFFLKHVPENEINMLIEINRAIFTFLNNTPKDDRIKISLSYDFHVQNKNNKYLINHKQTPLYLTQNGNIWLRLCIVSLSAHKQCGNIEARMNGNTDRWNYSLESHQWEKKTSLSLTDREKEILSFSAQGFTMDEIAEKLFLSIDAVKLHKQNLFKKTGVNNISKAIVIATNLEIL